MKPKEPKPALRVDRLYLGDNGRIFCGELRCAGMSSHYTRHDISGQEVLMVTPDILGSFENVGARIPTCEGCGKEASRIWTADDLYVVVAA